MLAHSVHPLPAMDLGTGKCTSRTEELRRNGHSPTAGVHPCAWMGECAPFCKFSEGAWGYAEKCFAVEERAARPWNEGPLLVSMVVMADVSSCREEKVSEEEA